MNYKLRVGKTKKQTKSVSFLSHYSQLKVILLIKPIVNIRFAKVKEKCTAAKKTTALRNAIHE